MRKKIASLYEKLLDCKDVIKWEHILNTICTIVCIILVFLMLYLISFIYYLDWLGNLILTLCVIALWVTRKKYLPYLIGIPTYAYYWARALFTRDIEHKYWKLIMLITQSCYKHSLDKNCFHIVISTYNRRKDNIGDLFFDTGGVPGGYPFMEWEICWNQYDREPEMVTVNCRFLEGNFRDTFSKDFPCGANQEYIYNSMLRGLDVLKIEYLEKKLRCQGHP